VGPVRGPVPVATLAVNEPTCPGPLIWYDVEDVGAVLECAHCDYIIVTGNFHDTAHADTPLMREGMATR